MLADYDKEVKRLKQHIAKLCWYMRGGVTLRELLDMPQSDYKHFGTVIEDNLELSKKAKQVIL